MSLVYQNKAPRCARPKTTIYIYDTNSSAAIPKHQPLPLQRRDARTTNPKQAGTNPERGPERDPLAAQHIAKRRAPEEPTHQRGNGTDQAGADVELGHRLACRERVRAVRGQAVGKAGAGGIHAQGEDEEGGACGEAETDDADRVGDEGGLGYEEVDGGCAASVCVSWFEKCGPERG